MRRLLAISLLLLFSLPLVLPLLGANAVEADVPVCCRRNGKHHCEMMMEMGGKDSSMSGVSEKCPYSLAPPAVVVVPTFAPSASASIYAGVIRHPALAAQAEAQFRVSFDRARQKRGPPAITA